MSFVVFAQIVGAAAEDVPEPKEKQEASEALSTALAELDREVEEILSDATSAGFVVAITDKDQIIWSKSYGHADEKKEKPIAIDTKFRVGSVSKVFTAAAVMKLVDQGLISLDDPLIKHAPDVEFNNKWEKTAPVRLSNLLEHTTGWDDIHFREYLSYDPNISLKEGLEINPNSRTSRWQPGLFHAYSNAGPAVLGRVIEEVTGEDYIDYLANEILRPIGAREAGFDFPSEELPQSFGAGKQVFSHTDIWAEPSGGLAISAEELSMFVRVFLNRGGDLLSEDAVRRMETPTTTLASKAGLRLGYGGGLEARQRSGNLYHLHTGAIDGFTSRMGYLPEAGLGYVVLSNDSISSDDVKVARKVFKLINKFGTPAEALAVDGDYDLAPLEGYYSQITARVHRFIFLDYILGATKVINNGDHITIKSVYFGEEEHLYPLGGGKLGPKDASFATHIAIQKNDKWIIATPDGKNIIRSSLASSVGYGVAMALSLFSTAVTILVLIIAVILRPFRKFSLKRTFALWSGSLLAGGSFCVFMLLLASALNDGITIIESLGTINLKSASLWGLSMAMPIFGGLGILYIALKSKAGKIQRGIGLLLTSLHCLFALLLAQAGWVGFQTWAYNVPTYPISQLFG